MSQQPHHSPPNSNPGRTPPRAGRVDCSANFVSHKIAVVDTPGIGDGVVATEPIRRGEVLVVYGGGFVDKDHIALIPEKMHAYYFQVAEGIWFGHGLNEEGMGIAERINHSCSPCAGFKGMATVVALRDIEIGEPITLDYAGMQTSDLRGSSFHCCCGSTNCRGEVAVDQWQRISSTEPLFQYLQPYIQARINPEATQYARRFAEVRFPALWHSPVVGGQLQSTLISQSVEVIDGQGAYAKELIPKGTAVFISSGIIVPGVSPGGVPDVARSIFRPLGREMLVGPRYDADLTPQKIVRKSSPHPNIEVRLGHVYVATRDIKPGEELTLRGKSVASGEAQVANQDCLTIPVFKNAFNANPRLSAPLMPRSSGATVPQDLEPRQLVSPPIEPQDSRGQRTDPLNVWQATTETSERFFKALTSFIRGAIREDWAAAPIALFASFAGTFMTAMSVTLLSPVFTGIFGSVRSAGYIMATSSMAIVLGYASYCLLYYGGMLIKERKDLFDDNGRFSKQGFAEKLQVFKADFLLHLPSDGYWVLGMFGAQGGLYASGVTDLFWSILLSQSVSDIYYSLREPFYWRGAKGITAWMASRSNGVDAAANSDVPVSADKQAAGNSR